MRRTARIALYLLIFTLAAGSALAQTPPVDFKLLGVDAARGVTRYQVRINTDKPVTQVDLHLAFVNQAGKGLMNTDLIWQNIVNSQRQPIVKGKTYTVEDFLPSGAVKAEGRRLRVFFKDGTVWKAPISH